MATAIDTLRIMRKSAVLESLFPSLRQEAPAALLLSPDKSWYMSELASHLKTSVSSLQRELDSLNARGILERRQDGRRTYYKARRDSPGFENLRDLFRKTAGVVPVLESELSKFGPGIRWAAIYGSIARTEIDRAWSEFDLPPPQGDTGRGPNAGGHASTIAPGSSGPRLERAHHPAGSAAF